MFSKLPNNLICLHVLCKAQCAQQNNFYIALVKEAVMSSNLTEISL
jgi:hypothetical protein